MNVQEIEKLKIEILKGAKVVSPGKFLLDDLLREYENKFEILLNALIELEEEDLIEAGSYTIGTDQLVSFIDVTITSKGKKSLT